MGVTIALAPPRTNSELCTHTMAHRQTYREGPATRTTNISSTTTSATPRQSTCGPDWVLPTLEDTYELLMTYSAKTVYFLHQQFANGHHLPDPWNEACALRKAMTRTAHLFDCLWRSEGEPTPSTPRIPAGYASTPNETGILKGQAMPDIHTANVANVPREFETACGMDSKPDTQIRQAHTMQTIGQDGRPVTTPKPNLARRTREPIEMETPPPINQRDQPVALTLKDGI